MLAVEGEEQDIQVPKFLSPLVLLPLPPTFVCFFLFLYYLIDFGC